ncbi:hypothetical protein HOE425_320234 [Hoeflea sp. EC-HK425]|nr:hypothetical protein HOE425_320234 [Hoeflea sp. EC-HK425]
MLGQRASAGGVPWTGGRIPGGEEPAAVLSVSPGLAGGTAGRGRHPQTKMPPHAVVSLFRLIFC